MDLKVSDNNKKHNDILYSAVILYHTPKRFTFKSLPVLRRVSQGLLDLSVHQLWAKGLFIGDVHLSGLGRLDKPRSTVRIER